MLGIPFDSLKYIVFYRNVIFLVRSVQKLAYRVQIFSLWLENITEIAEKVDFTTRRVLRRLVLSVSPSRLVCLSMSQGPARLNRRSLCSHVDSVPNSCAGLAIFWNRVSHGRPERRLGRRLRRHGSSSVFCFSSVSLFVCES